MAKIWICTIMLIVFFSACTNKTKIYEYEDINNIGDIIKEHILSNENKAYGLVGDIKKMNDSVYFVVDVRSGMLYKINTYSNEIAQIGKKGEGPGEYERVGSICYDKNNNIFANDVNKDKINRYSDDGKYIEDYKHKTNSQNMKMLYASNNKLYFLSGCGDTGCYLTNEDGLYAAKKPKIFSNLSAGSQANDFFEHNGDIYFMNSLEFTIFKYNVWTSHVEKNKILNMPRIYNWEPYYDMSYAQKELNKIVFTENPCLPIGFKHIIHNNKLYFVVMCYYQKENYIKYYIVNTSYEAILSFKTNNMILLDTNQEELVFGRIDKKQGCVDKIILYKLKDEVIK